MKKKIRKNNLKKVTGGGRQDENGATYTIREARALAGKKP